MATPNETSESISSLTSRSHGSVLLAPALSIQPWFIKMPSRLVLLSSHSLVSHNPMNDYLCNGKPRYIDRRRPGMRPAPLGQLDRLARFRGVPLDSLDESLLPFRCVRSRVELNPSRMSQSMEVEISLLCRLDTLKSPRIDEIQVLT